MTFSALELSLRSIPDLASSEVTSTMHLRCDASAGAENSNGLRGTPHKVEDSARPEGEAQMNECADSPPSTMPSCSELCGSIQLHGHYSVAIDG